LIAVIGFAALLVYVFRSGDDGPATPTAKTPASQEPISPLPPEQQPEPQPAAETPETRLSAIGRQVSEYLAERGVFPTAVEQTGVPPEQRLSWVAALILSRQIDGPQPNLEHGWSDPLNDRFARQRIEGFQNPLIETLTGPAGHPAGHFVGIAGVGADAPQLPVGHSRAGIFGDGRSTRVEDISDGLANTLLVAGVQNRFDSWAANTSATVRPLSAEPYFGGPDGFGTGEQGGMTVLMADGSVRFLSSDTDPRLLRRMAAMADGLPLDISVPGEPGETTSAPPPEVAEAPPAGPPIAGPDAEPIDVPVAADRPVFDINAALDQPIVEFNQPQPQAAGEILKLVGEMAGIAVDTTQLDASAAQRLERELTLSLENTSVRGVLDATVEAAGLSYSLGNGVVVLIAGDAGRHPEQRGAAL
jgi:hypothetical protein